MDIPARYIAVYPCFLPLYPYMLGIYAAGNNKARTAERTVARHTAYTALPSMGRLGL